MNLTVFIIACLLIAIVLILLPLLMSRKAEKELKNENEWEKIKSFENNINKKIRKKIK